MRLVRIIAVAALIASALGSPVQAARPHTATLDTDCTDGHCYGFDYLWNNGNPYWADEACTLDRPTWRVRFYVDADLSGRYVDVCSWQHTFCAVPVFAPSYYNIECDAMAKSIHLHDHASSLEWFVYSSSVDCIPVFADVDYAGARTRLTGYPTIHGIINYLGNFNVGNDTADSVKTSSPTSCVTQ